MFYFSLVLATMGGMMLGLLASAFAPNANSAPLMVILLIIPQVVLGGGLIPVPPTISGSAITRWAFEAVLASTGAGSDVAADACWLCLKMLGDAMTIEEKAGSGLQVHGGEGAARRIV